MNDLNEILPRNPDRAIPVRKPKLTAARRRLFEETHLGAANLVLPVSVDANIERPVEVRTMPGVFRYSLADTVDKAKELVDLGVAGIYLIGVPRRRDAIGSDAFSEDGIVARATRAIRDAVGDRLVVIGDAYIGYFTDHQVGGVLDASMKIDDAATRDVLARLAVTWARSGVDILCCSTMVAGRVEVSRRALEEAGLGETMLMSSIKFNSAFFKAGADFTTTGGSYGYDKSVYYIQPGNLHDAIRIASADVAEGAEMINVKPGTPYHDVVRRLKDMFGLPVSAFSISGDYAMVQFGVRHAGLDERSCALELLTGFRRAGADFVITYWAPDAARWLSRTA